MAAELWQFVQKQHAAVSKGNFSRTGRAATADESRSAGTVVWIAKWPLKDKIGVAAQGCKYRVMPGRAGSHQRKAAAVCRASDWQEVFCRSLLDPKVRGCGHRLPLFRVRVGHLPVL